MIDAYIYTPTHIPMLDNVVEVTVNRDIRFVYG